MNLILVRHGQAVRSLNDEERRLTHWGAKSSYMNFLYFQEFLPKIDIVFSSPLTRAAETAEILHSLYHVENDLIKSDSLSPGCRTEYVLNLIEGYEDKNVAVVGHLPDVANILSDLCSGSGMSADFSPGTVAWLGFGGKIREGGGTLRMLLPPKN